MDCTLTRSEFRIDGIFGIMLDDNGRQIAVTLEHAFANGAAWYPKLPDGIYSCQRYHSPKFGYDVFQIMNVPNATYIEIHIGNFNDDSNGCVLLGDSVSPANGAWAITSSKITFLNFMQLQIGLDQFQLTVKSVS